tara:strand:- start:2507 stop:3373 length:867 start_codon:yes stop_codon:yes gene_type:complete
MMSPTNTECWANKPTLVSVELSQGSTKLYKHLHLLSLQRDLLWRLTQEGFAVVAPQHKPTFKITLHGTKTRLSFSVRYRKRIRRGNTTFQAKRWQQSHLEATHHIVDLCRQFVRLLPKQPTKTKQASPRRLRWELGLSGGGMYRISGFDPLFLFSMRWGQHRGFGMHIESHLLPSVWGDLSIFEWGVQLGPTWRTPLNKHLALELGLLLGFTNHAYTLTSANSSGAEWDFMGKFTTWLLWQWHPLFCLRPWLSVGFASRARTHLNQNKELWKRSAFQVGAGLSIAVTL